MIAFGLLFFAALSLTCACSHALQQSPPCNIQKIDIQSIEEAVDSITEFPSIPVIFVGKADRNKALAQASSMEKLIDEYGETIVTLASSNTFSHDTIDMSLSQYLKMLDVDNHLSQNAKANETYYLFGNNFSDLFKKLEDKYILPPCKYCKDAGAVTVGIGGLRSGVSFHFHGPGFSEVISGRKQFFLYPPDMAINIPVPPNLTMSQWVEEIYPTLDKKQYINPKSQECGDEVVSDHNNAKSDNNGNIYASTSDILKTGEREEKIMSKFVPETIESFYECVLLPGDMLYFPDKWQHATLNLDHYNTFVSVFLDLQLLKRAFEKDSATATGV